jgi:transcriptional regulator with XRE-family HTH domain
MFVMAFGTQLQTLRKIKGWTQLELSDASGVHRTKIADYERGKTVPSWPTAVKLAAALEVEMDAFLDLPRPKKK